MRILRLENILASRENSFSIFTLFLYLLDITNKEKMGNRGQGEGGGASLAGHKLGEDTGDVPFCSASFVAVCGVSKNRAPCLMACRRKEEALRPSYE